ncbi:hypothetical protein NC651_018919 [Populus alba x Populus x berolinensis]|nr:hypothetical protein NC651_018919 [Populus alba x Populus x berolinensis]
MKESKNPTKPHELKTSKNLKNQDFLQTGIVVEMMMKMNLESILKTHMEITLKNQTLRMLRKGADFKHLLDEALSKCHQVDNFHSLEDFLAVYVYFETSSQFRLQAWSRPLAFSQGESILSWIGDDNFVVEDKTTSTHEASFLSLNLHALAEQLAKVDVSGRLFIEADLLATELGSNTSSSQEYDQLQTTGSEASSSHGPDRKPTTQTKATLTISEESAFEDFSEKNKAVSQNTKVFASGLTVGNTDPFSFIQGSDVKGNLNRNQCGKSNQSTAPEPPEQFNVSSVVPKNRLPTFEAEAAESNLYMLPGSLSETKKCLSLRQKPLLLLPLKMTYLMIYLRKHLICQTKTICISL